MLNAQRMDEILNLVEQRKFVTVSELTKIFKVSEMTIRRDLKKLYETNLIERTFGGAKRISNNVANFTFFQEQINCNKKEKVRIARSAADMVKDGETVIIDGGTSAYYVAEQLRNKNIQVVTHSLPVINFLSEFSNIELVSVGGILYAKAGVFLSSLTEGIFKQINADKLFMGVGGIDGEQITNQNMLLVETQKVMMSVSKEIIVVADHTKFGKRALNYLGEISCVHRIITDSKVPQQYKVICKKNKILLTVA